jgi:hypothetical protein
VRLDRNLAARRRNAGARGGELSKGIVAASAILWPCIVSAQDVIQISAEPPACAVVLDEAIGLGDLDDPGTVGPVSQITQITSGDFLVAHLDNGARIMVYDPDGRYRESIDRRGEGPGEFSDPGIGKLRPAPGGGVLILDPGTRRITHLSAAWSLLETTQVGAMFPLNFVPLGSERGFVVGGWGGADDGRFAAVAEHLDAEGAVRQTLAQVPTDRGLINHFFAPTAVDDEGRVWRSLPVEYAVEAWDPAAPDRFLRLEGRPEWFRPWPPPDGDPLEVPPFSMIHGLRHRDGLLWIATSVADDDGWREAVANPVPGVPIDGNRRRDTVVEVVDPATGALVARSVLDDWLWWTGDGGYLYAARDEGLVSKAALFTVRLEGEDCP